jgi:hypothetical protein
LTIRGEDFFKRSHRLPRVEKFFHLRIHCHIHLDDAGQKRSKNLAFARKDSPNVTAFHKKPESGASDKWKSDACIAPRFYASAAK